MKMKILEAKQEAKLNMYQVVRGHCDSNSTIVNTNLAFKNAVGEFGAKVAGIESAAELVSAVLTGIATDKTVSKETLSREASKIAGLIYAYAAKTGNNTLKQAVNFSFSDLKRLKDAEVAPRCQAIHDAGNDNLAALGDFGVTKPKLDALQALIDGYETHLPKPRTAIAERSTRKANIKQLFKDADAILVDQMDKLVEDLAADNPDFVKTYKSARKIVDPKSKAKESGDIGDKAGNTNPPA